MYIVGVVLQQLNKSVQTNVVKQLVPRPRLVYIMWFFFFFLSFRLYKGPCSISHTHMYRRTGIRMRTWLELKRKLDEPDDRETDSCRCPFVKKIFFIYFLTWNIIVFLFFFFRCCPLREPPLWFLLNVKYFQVTTILSVQFFISVYFYCKNIIFIFLKFFYRYCSFFEPSYRWFFFFFFGWSCFILFYYCHPWDGVFRNNLIWGEQKTKSQCEYGGKKWWLMWKGNIIV